MSKIADYLEQLENERIKAQEQREKQTVADFAKELNKSSDTLLIQLRKAGVQKESEIDRITEVDKQELLRFLKADHERTFPSSRKKIVLKKATSSCESDEDRRLKAVAEQENGAEWECLNQFMHEVIAGNNIDSNLQTVINLIIAKAVIFEALPLKKLGRPKSKEAEDLGKKVAQAYWDMRDTGISYSEAVSQLAEKFHKDERHVMKLVERHKESVGTTFEDRKRNRELTEARLNFFETTRMVRPIGQSSNMRELLGFSPIPPDPPDFTWEDCIEYLDEKIVKTVKARGFTGIKETTFIASD